MKNGLKKSRNANVGDIIMIPQSNGDFTAACIIGIWPRLKSIMTIALFSRECKKGIEYDSDFFNALESDLAAKSLLAVISTPVLPTKKGEWSIVGGVSCIGFEDLLPDTPFKTDSLVGACYEGAPLVEGLIEAYRGLADWESLLPGRSGYLKGLLFGTL